MPTVFLSHSNKDNDFTRFLADALSPNGFEIWVDFDSIGGGEEWLEAIEKAVESCDAFVVVMSKAARGSQWVRREALMALELKKPIFIARIDDIPLPLHLIDRQYTDFVSPDPKDRERTLKKLISALQKRKSPARKLSPEPNEKNFFPYLETLPGGEVHARVARELYQWGGSVADRVEFSGGVTPGFHLRASLGENEVIVMSVRAFPRQPAVQVQFLYLRDYPPYDDARMRRSTLESLNRLLDEPLLEDKADRRPTISLSALDKPDSLNTFKQIIAEIFDNLRSV